MRAGSPGCRLPRWPGAARDQVLRAAWSRRQVTPRRPRRQSRRRRRGDREFTAVLPAGAASLVPRGRQDGGSRQRGPAAARVSGRCWASSGPTWWRPDWFRDPGDRPPVRSRALRLPRRPPFGGAGRQHQAGLGDLPPAAPHAAGHCLVPHAARTSTPNGWPSSSAPGGRRIPSCPAFTGRAASSSASG